MGALLNREADLRVICQVIGHSELVFQQVADAAVQSVSQRKAMVFPGEILSSEGRFL